jgi:hypothetical protein
MSLLDKIKRMNERKPERGSFSSHKDIFHSFRDGDNIIRLVGEFLEVRTHFIAPVPKRSDRGLCLAKAFQGDKRLPQLVNCLNWDVAKEEARPAKDSHCPFCKLNDIARKALKGKPSAEEKKFWEGLKASAYPRTGLKWHLIDRDDPFVLRVVDGKEEKVKGLKIGTIGTELWKDIEGIFNQCGSDITNPKDGIDICVTKTVAAKTNYAGKAVLVGKPPTVKVTPLTPEELAYELYDLKAICGKQTELDLLMDALHTDLREVLDINAGETTPDAETPPEDAPPVPTPPPTVRHPVTATAAKDDDDVLGGEELPGLPAKKK